MQLNLDEAEHQRLLTKVLNKEELTHDELLDVFGDMHQLRRYLTQTPDQRYNDGFKTGVQAGMTHMAQVAKNAIDKGWENRPKPPPADAR